MARPDNIKHDTFLAFLLYASLYFGDNFNFNLGVKISFADLILLLFFGWIVLTSSLSIRFSPRLIPLFILMGLCASVEFLSLIVIDLGDTENITLGVAIIRNALLILLMYQLTLDHARLQKYLVYAAFLFSTIAIIFYARGLLNIELIVKNRHLWDPGLFYTLDSGYLRLQGFNEGPNMFFIVNYIPLFFSIMHLKQKRTFSAFLFSLVIMLASLLTFSRTGVIIILFTVLVSLLGRINFKKLILISAIISLFFAGSQLISHYFEVPSIYEVIKARYEMGKETGGSGRLKLWEIAWKGFEESPLFGQGGRYVLKTGGNYAHNDFLEILSSHGIIGFLFMFLTYGYVLFYIVHERRELFQNDFLKTNCYFFMIFLLASLFFTIYYNPYIWIVVGFIFSKKTRNHEQNEFICNNNNL